MREYTALPNEYLEEMETLTAEEYGRLIRGLQHYHITGEIPELEGNEKHFIKRVCNRDDRYKESFEETDRRRKAAAEKAIKARWEKEKANGNENERIRTNTNEYAKGETKAKTKAKTKAETEIINIKDVSAEAEASAPAAVVFDCIKNEQYKVYDADVTTWADTYPALDIMQELKKMKAWLTANPKNKKSKNGMPRFINTWLSKDQDRAARVGGHNGRGIAERSAEVAKNWNQQPVF